MRRIVPSIESLRAHLTRWANLPQDYRPERCPTCGLGGLWNHGTYGRKADRERQGLGTIPVPRFLCGKKGGCGASCSTLPSCLPPRRWYLWKVQQAGLEHLLQGGSLRQCGQTFGSQRRPTPRTVRRWWRWLQGRHELFAFYLRSQWQEWGRASDWRAFWRGALDQEPLRELAAFLDHQGVIVP